MNNINVRIENNDYKKSDGTFDLDKAISFSGHIAGICYDEQGYDHVLNEDKEKTEKRAKMTMDNGHHSVYDHIYLTFYIKGLSKILAMVLNNEKEYTTSERSLRYTKLKGNLDDSEVLEFEEPFLSMNNARESIITDQEIYLYNKWLKIFQAKIEEKYSGVYNQRKLKTLSQENARALATVFMPTEMIYTTSLRQINYIASWMFKFIENVENNYIEPWMYKYLKDKNGYFNSTLVWDMKRFLSELDRLHVLVPGLMQNEKDRSLSLFTNNIENVVEYFGNVYVTKYKGSFAEIAQAQRHRTLDYQIKVSNPLDAEFSIPEIIKDDDKLVAEWIKDISSLRDIIPIGELVDIVESGKYENFILKCKERLCSHAQLEVMQITRDTLLKYKKALEDSNHPLASDIEKYSHGARCTFPDFKCNAPCGNKEGIQLVRKI